MGNLQYVKVEARFDPTRILKVFARQAHVQPAKVEARFDPTRILKEGSAMIHDPSTRG